MRKPCKTRYMIETMIMRVEDIKEKRIFIKMYNDKLKRLSINEVYEPIFIEKI